jgi:dipeptidyl aminopeptidase/acylaminoacyl peptidase
MMPSLKSGLIAVIGQYPDFFDAAIVRNPVISCEPASSDIPDWYYAEFGLPFGPESVMTPALYEKLYGMSPIAHVGGIRARVLLQMGAMDARVAPTHALALYHALKGRGRTVEMLCFPKSGHALDGAQVERVCVGAIVDWLKGAK